MLIQLLCHRTELTSPGCYKSYFSQTEKAQEIPSVFIEADLPAIPGNFYSLLIKGMFPGMLQSCVVEITKLTIGEALISKTLKLPQDIK